MCGLLSDDDGEDPDEGTPEAQDPDGDSAEADPVDGPREDATEADPAGGQGDEGAESDLDVESTLKDLAARMSRLSSHIEGIEEDREDMEDKLDDVENQLGQLGNLAEVVSSQYNPFVTEDAPANPEWNRERKPAGGDGTARPPAASPGPPDRDDVVLEETSLEAVPGEDPAGLEEDDLAPGGEEATPGADDDGTGAGPGEALDGDGLPPALGEDSDHLLDAAGRDGAGDGPPDPASLDLADAPDPTAEGEDAFDRNVLLLEWVGHLMEKVGRDGLLDLLEYYESLGWLEEPLKNRALRVATGIDVETGSTGGREWRGDTELHERTLVVLERLAGRRRRPESRLEELQLDLGRIFDR